MPRVGIQKYKARKNRASGFTLIELLVVLAIISLLAMVTAPQVLKHLDRAKTQTARLEIKNIGTALDLYRIDMSRYPTQEEGLDALIKQPPGAEHWKGPYLDKKTTLNDPWGATYIYRIPGKNGDYDLISYGADKAEGGTGDNEDVTN